MDWFEELFGFREEDEEVRDVLEVVGGGEDGEGWREEVLWVRSRRRGDKYGAGCFEVVSVQGLRERRKVGREGCCTFSIVHGEVSKIQADGENLFSTFQVASQFNCLEFASPDKTPEDGVTIYAQDPTQGPACSVGCGPAAVYRNYFVPMPSGGVGQSRDDQLDLLGALRRQVGEDVFPRTVNGYTFAEQVLLRECSDISGDVHLLEVGIHRDVEVVSTDWGRNLVEHEQFITQVFCAAPSVAYNSCNVELWEGFSRPLLEAGYEACFLAALENHGRHAAYPSSRRLFLTLVGGGVFGNPLEWIVDSLKKCLVKYSRYPLDVYLVVHGDQVSPLVSPLPALYPKTLPQTPADSTVVVCVIVRQTDSLLMVQECKEECYGEWYIPAGRMEVGETLEQAAIREVKEETGLLVRLEGIVGVEYFPSKESDWTRVCFSAQVVGGSLKVVGDEESLSAAWIPLDDLYGDNIPLRYNDFFQFLTDFEDGCGIPLPVVEQQLSHFSTRIVLMDQDLSEICVLEDHRSFHVPLLPSETFEYAGTRFLWEEFSIRSQCIGGIQLSSNANGTICITMLYTLDEMALDTLQSRGMLIISPQQLSPRLPNNNLYFNPDPSLFQPSPQSIIISSP